MTIGLFYGSSNGNTEGAANLIKEAFDQVQPGMVTLVNVAYADLGTLPDYEKLILGSSSWDNGELQDDWRDVFAELDSFDLAGKQVAVFGFGDQVEYPTTFQDAIGTLAQKARERGAQLVGCWPTEGYTFEQSLAVEDGVFVGLSLDNDNQRQLTAPRISAWVQQLVQEFGLA
jgi:flavodoxin I